VALLAIVAAGLIVAGCVSVTRVADEPEVPSAAPSASSARPSPSGLAPETTPGAPGRSDVSTASPGQAEVSAAPSPLQPGQRRLGYLSLDESNAFVRSVSEGILASAASAGLQLVGCDSGWTREGVIACAEHLGDMDIEALISFQPFADLGPQVCAATGDIPTVGIVFDQGPCQVARLEIDQAESGRLAGDAVGRFAAQQWGCDVSAYLSLESSDADPDGRARMAGYRAGFEEHCPLPDRTVALDGADRLVTAQTQVAGLLDELPGKRLVVVGLNEDAILGAMAAADAAGREGELWYSGQLADPSIREHIACDRQYIASVAQFPERFGEDLVPLLVRALDGEPVPELVTAPLELVTAANVRQLFPETPSCSE
jgi:ribose transport system substrate-binding protein